MHLLSFLIFLIFILIFYLPAPPVPGRADRLLGEDEAGDVDHVEEEVADDVGRLGPSQLQAIAKPASG